MQANHLWTFAWISVTISIPTFQDRGRQTPERNEPVNWRCFGLHQYGITAWNIYINQPLLG